jgi:hypothetical protein
VSQVLDRGGQAVAPGSCLLQVLDHGAQAAARGAARCVSQLLDLGPRAVARGAATLIAKRRDAAAAGEEQLDGCSAGRLYSSRRSIWQIASWRARHRRRVFEP